MSDSPPPHRQPNRSVGSKWQASPITSRECSPKRVEPVSSPTSLARVRLASSPVRSFQSRGSPSSGGGPLSSPHAMASPTSSVRSSPLTQLSETNRNMVPQAPLPPASLPPPPLGMADLPLPTGPIGLSLDTQGVMLAMAQMTAPMQAQPRPSAATASQQGAAPTRGAAPTEPRPAPIRTAAPAQPRPAAGSPARPSVAMQARQAAASREAGPPRPRFPSNGAGRYDSGIGTGFGTEEELRRQIKDARGAIEFATFEINRLSGGSRTTFNPSLTREQEIHGLQGVIANEEQIIARCDQALKNLGVGGASATTSTPNSPRQTDSRSSSSMSESSKSGKSRRRIPDSADSRRGSRSI